MKYWMTKDAKKLYIVLSSGYACYVQAVDVFGTLYYQPTGVMNHLPNPENLIHTEETTVDLELYKAAKAKGVL